MIFYNVTALTLFARIHSRARITSAGPSRSGPFVRRTLRALIAAALFAIIVSATVSNSFAIEIKKSGNLVAPASAELLVFSTDATFQQVLSDDFATAHRAAGAQSHSPLTLTVTVNQKPLKPGVSLNDLALGAPQVADLIKAAGATPPPIGDTGDEVDSAAYARTNAERQAAPRTNPMEQVINQIQTHGALGPPAPCDPQSPGCNNPAAPPAPEERPANPGEIGDTQEYVRQGRAARRFHPRDDSSYDNVVVARASISGAPDELTVVAVAHPGEDVRAAKKLMAEEIANAVLH